MISVTVLVESQRTADALHEFLSTYFVPPKKTAKETLFSTPKTEAHQAPTEPIKLTPPPPASTPLEQAIAEKTESLEVRTERGERVEAEPAAQDPFAMLSEVAAPVELAKLAEPEKPAKKTTAKKQKVEDRQTIAEPAPLLLTDIRRISDAVCEAIGMDTIREALAKFAAKDEKGTLRMSALRPQDYALYVEFLNKKMNDAGKERAQ